MTSYSPVNPKAAYGWFKKAAAGDIPAAAHFYAEHLERGDVCAADPAEAAVWYRKAVDLGHHLSLCSLANLYAASGEQEFLALARRFEQARYVEPLARGEDRLAGEHANSFIPNVVGATFEL